MKDPLETYCPVCGGPLDIEDGFCDQCGYPDLHEDEPEDRCRGCGEPVMRGEKVCDECYWADEDSNDEL